ncbi:unnamed protein product [Ectocarpus sp. 12 AP-2014]
MMRSILDPSRGMILEDTEYWLGHPELQGMVAHFMAKVLEQRPSDAHAFACEIFGHPNLKEQVDQAVARSGGAFGEQQRRQWAARSPASRDEQGVHGKIRSNEKESRGKASRDNSSRSREKGSSERSSRDTKTRGGTRSQERTR